MLNARSLGWLLQRFPSLGKQLSLMVTAVAGLLHIDGWSYLGKSECSLLLRMVPYSG